MPRMLIRAFIVILAFNSICAAYGDLTHRNVVRDAFEFIIANKGDASLPPGLLPPGLPPP